MAGPRGITIALAAAAMLAGCQDGGFSLGDVVGGQAEAGAVPFAGAGQTTELVERDVEAPEVFQVSEQGLWDGRPSLGGVWVAHPDVTDPERVIIRNTENGAFVIGALFRRERDNPGPSLQVSSDAAEALQMLAGAPAALNVTALRREESPPVPAAPVIAATAAEIADPAEVMPAPDGITTTPLDPVAGAAAAIDAAEAEAEAGTAPAADLATALPPPVVIDGPMAAAPVAATTLPAAAPATSDLSQPFIQIGIFSVEANARGAAADLDAMGLPTRVAADTSQGRDYWRVLVGPAQTSAERAGYLDRVRAEGFADAYFVRN